MYSMPAGLMSSRVTWIVSSGLGMLSSGGETALSPSASAETELSSSVYAETELSAD
jgi:hypothetical protein